MAAKAEEAAERVHRLEHELREARQAKHEREAAEGGTAVKGAEVALREARRAAERVHGELERLEQ